MRIYSESNNYILYHGDMLNMAEIIKPNTIDAIVCDPPYELNFMNKGWDNAGISFNKGTWKKCLDALKPGGYLLAFGGSRTYHRIACAIEDAGFEIRDTIMYLYGSGFPKSMNIGLAIDKKNGVDNRTGVIRTDGKATNPDSKIYNFNDKDKQTSKFEKVFEERIAQNRWAGWGTALKPAYEPIIVARKPLKGSCVDNVMKYGVGGINIDELREICNYFSSKEEAKLAVERLKVWKRLKDKGADFVFIKSQGIYGNVCRYRIELCTDTSTLTDEDARADLDLLFSRGEE